MQEEKQHRIRQLPLDKKEVEYYRKRWREINARPIKKVAEAKARKKRRVNGRACRGSRWRVGGRGRKGEPHRAPSPDAEEAGADQEEGRSCGQHGGHLRAGESGTASKVRGGESPARVCEVGERPKASDLGPPFTVSTRRQGLERRNARSPMS